MTDSDPCTRSPASSRSPGPTLEAVLTPLPMLGVWRLARFMAQLAAEIDAADEAGLALNRVAPDTIHIERAGTPFERACLAPLPPASGVGTAAAIRGLGVSLASILGSKPLFLDAPGSARSTPRRRADADAVQALARGLHAIARRCASRDARYRDASQLRADLDRLCIFAERLAKLRQPRRPVVTIAYPKVPRAVPQLPKVIVTAA